MTKPDALALADELDTKSVRRWIHSTGGTPCADGSKADPLSRQAAAELRRLHAETTNQKDWLVEWRKWEEEAKRLTLENEALRKYKSAAHLIAEDAGRFQWMQDHALAIDTVADPDNQVQIWHGTDPARCTYGKTLSEAVDTAMKEANHG